MKVSNNLFLIKFSDDGQILYSNAPFINSHQDNISDYLPFFDNPKDILAFENKWVPAYEFVIENSRYFCDLKFTTKRSENRYIYEVLLKDYTQHYELFQKERTKKNEKIIENEYLKVKSIRLESKIKELESFIEDHIIQNVKLPVRNLHSGLDIIANRISSSDINTDLRLKRIIDMSKKELQLLEEVMGHVVEYQNISNRQSFDTTEYCGLKEIKDDAFRNLEFPESLQVVDHMSESIQVYVHKFHFTKIFFLIADLATNIVEGEQTTFVVGDHISEDKKLINLEFHVKGIENIIECKNRMLNLFSDKQSLKQSENIKYLMLNKMVKLYQGTIETSFPDDNSFNIVLSFNNLLPKINAA